jgi:hypothetical protein
MSDERVDVTFGAKIRDLLSGLKEAHAATRDSVEGMKGHLEGLNKVVDTVKTHWMGIVAVLGGGKLFKEAIEGTLDWTYSVVQLSKRLGITTEEASGLNVALHHLGIASDEYNSFATKMTKQLRSNEDAFTALGIRTKEQNGEWRNTQAVMADAIEKLNNMKAGTDRNIASQALFGARVGNMTSILRLNKELLQESAEKAEKYHLIVGPDGAAKVRAYKDAMWDVKLVGESVKVQIGNALLPVLLRLGEWFGESGPALTGVFTTAIQWIQYELTEFGRDLQDLAFRWDGFVEDISIGSGHLAAAFKKLMHGDFAGAKAEMVSGWGEIRAQSTLTATAIAENARETEAALQKIFAPQKASKKTEGESLGGDALKKDPKAKDERLAEADRQWGLLKNVSEKGKDDLLKEEMDYWQKQHDLVTGNSKEDVKLREQLLLKKLAAQHAYNGDAKRAAMIETQIVRDGQLEQLDIEKQAIEERHALREIDHQEAAVQLRALANQALDIRNAQFDDEEALAHGDMEKLAAIDAKRAASFRIWSKELATVNKTTTLGIAKDWEGVFSHFTNALQTSFQGVIQGTQTLRQALGNLWRNVALDFAASKAQELKVHLAGELAKRGITTSSALHSVASTAWAALKNVAAYAAQAAAAAWAAISAIPFVGPFLAPAAAGVALAGVLALGSHIASAAGGYDIPAGLNPMTQLHAQEMVLPAELANKIRGMTDGSGGGGAQYHFHVAAMDAKSFHSYLQQNSDAVGDAAAAAVKSGRLSPKKMGL